jgi:hypothetical protein
MIRIIAYDIAGGVNQEQIGVFQSVQMTGNELRDEDGNVILRWFDHVWFSVKSGNGWYDWTIQAVA